MSCGALGLEAARGNNRALEDLAQALCCDRRLTLGDNDITLRARLDDVEIGEAEAVQSVCYISEQYNAFSPMTHNGMFLG
jgi:hypothetical protein